MNDNASYQTFKRAVNWDTCEKKFFDSLSFLSLFDNLSFLKNKKVKAKLTTDTASREIGYFFDGKLLRIENIIEGTTHEDTFLIWDGDCLSKVYWFNLGFSFGSPTNDGIKISYSWIYHYQNKKLDEIQWVIHKNKRLGPQEDNTIKYKYEYDEKGLRFIYKSWEDDLAELEPAILFDREKEIFLKTCTLTKIPLTNRTAKTSDNVVDFENKGLTKVGNCDSCGNSLTFVLSLNLQDKRFNSQKVNLDTVPVLFCFDCLESVEYLPSDLKTSAPTLSPFTDRKFKFKRETIEENEEEAFLKIGGQPNWIQDEEHPNCNMCSAPMKFLIQINTDEALTNGQHVLAIGDSGKLYVFACCNIVKCIPQGY